MTRSRDPAAHLADLGLVLFGVAEHERGRLAVEGVRRVRVGEQLREEDLEHVDEVCAGQCARALRR